MASNGEKVEAKDLVVGKIYRIVSSRFGACDEVEIMDVALAHDRVSVQIVEGSLQLLREKLGPGDEHSLRISQTVFATVG